MAALSTLSGCTMLQQRDEQRDFVPSSVEGAACQDRCTDTLAACRQTSGNMKNCSSNYQTCINNCRAAEEGMLEKAFNSAESEKNK